MQHEISKYPSREHREDIRCRAAIFLRAAAGCEGQAISFAVDLFATECQQASGSWRYLRRVARGPGISHPARFLSRVYRWKLRTSEVHQALANHPQPSRFLNASSSRAGVRLPERAAARCGSRGPDRGFAHDPCRGSTAPPGRNGARANGRGALGRPS